MSGAAKTSFQRYFVESSEYFVYSILSQKDRIIHLFDSFNQVVLSLSDKDFTCTGCRSYCYEILL